MYIEDLFLLFSGHSVNPYGMPVMSVRVGLYETQLVSSLGDQISRGTALTEKQSKLVLKLLHKYRDQIKHHHNIDVPPILVNPQFKKPLRTSDVVKRASVITKNGKKYISLSFPYIESLVADIKKFHYDGANQSMSSSKWDPDERAWLLSLDENNIKFCIETIDRMSFQYDEEFQTYIDQYKDIVSNFEDYIPMIKKVDNIYSTVNLKNEETFDDPAQALINARKLQIKVIDDEVLSDFEELNLSTLEKLVLKTTDEDDFFVPTKDFSRADMLRTVLHYNEPTAIIVHDSITENQLKEWVHAFAIAGIDLAKVGVMFRRKNDNPAATFFNNAIKDYGLNKPVEADLQFMFVNSKYPKSLIKEGKVAKMFINDNVYVNAHYTLKTLQSSGLLTLWYAENPKYVGETVCRLAKSS